MPQPGEFPTRENCDPNNPSEAFLWMFAALPFVKGGPLLMPPDYYRLVSEHLWKLGCRPVEEPTLEWVPPQASDPNWFTSPGRWVPAGTAPPTDPADEARAAVARMSLPQRGELFAVLSQGEPFGDSPAGQVAQRMSPEQRDVVLRVLKEATS